MGSKREEQKALAEPSKEELIALVRHLLEEVERVVSGGIRCWPPTQISARQDASVVVLSRPSSSAAG